MRDLKELYAILLEKYKRETEESRYGTKGSGYICNTILFLGDDSIITKEEQELLFTHFKSQRPTEEIHPEFYNHPLYTRESSVWFNWFDYGKTIVRGSDSEGVIIRVEFLQKIINIL